MELTAHVLSSAASVATIVAAFLGGAGVVVAGKVPRAGPLRALALGFSSRYLPLVRGATVSQRGAEVSSLRLMLSASDDDHFVIVNGPKGVGACRVQATRHTRRSRYFFRSLTLHK
jgi:hypothetical protein